MAYDIYGNDLRPGYCEVHPHVGQEYPCFVCGQEIQAENNRQKQERSHAFNEGKIYEIDFDGHVLTKLKFENGKL